MRHFWMNIAREGEGAGGGGAAAGAGDPGAGGTPGGDGGAGGAAGRPEFIPQGLELPADMIGSDAPSTIGTLYAKYQEASKPPYDPEKLPDEYKGKQPGEVFEMAFKRIEGLRGELGKRGEVPKDAAGYEYEPAEAAKPFFRTGPNGEPDPMLEATRKVALDAGMTSQQFSTFLNGFFEQGLSGGMIAAPINPKAEIASFAKAEGLADEVAASRRVDELSNWGKKFAEQFRLGEAEATEIDILTDTAAGLRVLSTMQKALMERGLDLGGGSASGKTMSDDEFAKLSGSDELSPGHKDYNPERRKQWEIESNRRADLKKRAG